MTYQNSAIFPASEVSFFGSNVRHGGSTYRYFENHLNIAIDRKCCVDDEYI